MVTRFDPIPFDSFGLPQAPGRAILIEPMADDPIAQRAANRKGHVCPIFWRQFGGRFALFLGLYPWIVTASFLAWKVYRKWVQQILPTPHASVIGDYMEILHWTLYVLGVLLFHVGLIWLGMTHDAWKRGFVSDRLFSACIALGFGGVFIVLVVHIHMH